ncbi:YfiT family bacillithiol transferase [Chengkuizengella axinellae]|uniref:Metal-dependent hydrolase n=1 Tax=Chengkuizengella axinellae TaxID=3064388 RepID=A0ABT9IVR6_9BACL|nr:putative metal-dependent hydrolase [Chengkuizengella sp. 2205SS18-9]MDP5272880.1 putative metal-dependent hydrolase [Chengkuizengella sp. 2205SS18-9]
MDHLRYPIGIFEPIHNPNHEHRNIWIEEIIEIPKTLRHTVQNLTLDQLKTPYRSGGWTVQQVVHHMADNDMNAYIRFKRALTEENPISSSYREDLWAELSDYDTSIESSLFLLEHLHNRFSALLRSLEPSEFQRAMTSPTHGVMSLDVAAQRYVWHGQHHIAQIASLKKRMGW